MGKKNTTNSNDISHGMGFVKHKTQLNPTLSLMLGNVKGLWPVLCTMMLACYMMSDSVMELESVIFKSYILIRFGETTLTYDDSARNTILDYLVIIIIIVIIITMIIIVIIILINIIIFMIIITITIKMIIRR